MPIKFSVPLVLVVFRLTPLGEPPSPRAAHVAAAVGTMVVIQVSYSINCLLILLTGFLRYNALFHIIESVKSNWTTLKKILIIMWNVQGGIGPTGLSDEDLHVLDLTQQRPRWHRLHSNIIDYLQLCHEISTCRCFSNILEYRVIVQGHGPGPRYGHVMAFVGQRFLLLIAGNDGTIILFVHVEADVLVPKVSLHTSYLVRPFMKYFIMPGRCSLADVWVLDTAAKPYVWRKLEPEGEGPPPCMWVS